MAKIILILISLAVFSANAQFLGFGGDSDESSGKISSIMEKLKNTELEPNPQSEESFNLLVKEMEVAIDEEKLFCSGEAANVKGKYLSSDKRQVCTRNLKQKYVEILQIVFDHKIKYLEKIGEIQMQKLKFTKDQMIKEVETRF